MKYGSPSGPKATLVCEPLSAGGLARAFCAGMAPCHSPRVAGQCSWSPFTEFREFSQRVIELEAQKKHMGYF